MIKAGYRTEKWSTSNSMGRLNPTEIRPIVDYLFQTSRRNAKSKKYERNCQLTAELFK